MVYENYLMMVRGPNHTPSMEPGGCTTNIYLENVDHPKLP